MVELKEPFATLWRGKDPFEEVKTLQGEVFRELETRRTLRFEMAGKSYFLKWRSEDTRLNSSHSSPSRMPSSA